MILGITRAHEQSFSGVCEIGKIRLSRQDFTGSPESCWREYQITPEIQPFDSHWVIQTN